MFPQSLATTKKTAVAKKTTTTATRRKTAKIVEDVLAPEAAAAAAPPKKPRKTAAAAKKKAEPAAEVPYWLTAVHAAESKKAVDIKVLDLREVTSFADYFVICSGTNPRQVQAIAEEIDVELGKLGHRATSLEGFKNGEWILADYGDMIVHVFSPKARDFYELERLWRHAKPVEIPAAG